MNIKDKHVTLLFQKNMDADSVSDLDNISAASEEGIIKEKEKV